MMMTPDKLTWDPWKQLPTPQPCWSWCSWHMPWISSSSDEVLIPKWTLLLQCQAEDSSFSSKKITLHIKNFGCTKMSLDNETTTRSKNVSFLPQTSLLIQQSTIQITGHGHPLMSRNNLFPVD